LDRQAEHRSKGPPGRCCGKRRSAGPPSSISTLSIRPLPPGKPDSLRRGERGGAFNLHGQQHMSLHTKDGIWVWGWGARREREGAVRHSKQGNHHAEIQLHGPPGTARARRRRHGGVARNRNERVSIKSENGRAI